MNRDYIDERIPKLIASADGKHIVTVEVIRDVIESFPAADVEPVRHGHWDTISDSDMSKTVMCSVCNKMFYFTKKGQLNIDKMPYCPKCGAKMDGVDNAR